MSNPISIIGNAYDMCAYLQPNSYLRHITTGLVAGLAINGSPMADLRPFAGGNLRPSETRLVINMTETVSLDLTDEPKVSEYAWQAVAGSDKCARITGIGKQDSGNFNQDYKNGNFNKLNSSGSHSRQSGWPPPPAHRNWVSPGGGTTAAS